MGGGETDTVLGAVGAALDVRCPLAQDLYGRG